MQAVKWDKDENIAVITMNNGENRHNPDYARGMLAALNEIESDKTITAVVIRSSDPKSWSQGIDIQWLMGRMGEKDTQAIKDFMYLMNDVFKRLLLYPMPVIAAINGHAFGNGAIISCACDFRFMKADRGFFCFPEVDLGIPFLPGMIAFVTKAIPYYKYNEMKLTGKRVGAAEMAEHHIIEKACDNEEILMKEATAFAKSFNKKRGIFGEMKKRLHGRIIEIMDQEDREFIEKLFLMITE